MIQSNFVLSDGINFCNPSSPFFVHKLPTALAAQGLGPRDSSTDDLCVVLLACIAVLTHEEQSLSTSVIRQPNQAKTCFLFLVFGKAARNQVCGQRCLRCFLGQLNGLLIPLQPPLYMLITPPKPSPHPGLGSGSMCDVRGSENVSASKCLSLFVH